MDGYSNNETETGLVMSYIPALPIWETDPAAMA